MAGVSDENNDAEFGAVVRNNRVVVANPSTPNHEPAGSAAETARFTESRRGQTPPPSPPLRVLDKCKMKLLFEKKLTPSDVHRRRIVIPKEDAEAHLPPLEAEEGFWHLDDMDLMQNWTIKFGFWHNRNSREYLFKDMGKFIAYHGLGPGDSIMVFKHDDGSYAIGVRKNVVQVPADQNINNVENNAAIHNPGTDDWGWLLNQDNSIIENDFGCLLNHDNSIDEKDWISQLLLNMDKHQSLVPST